MQIRMTNAAAVALAACWTLGSGYAQPAAAQFTAENVTLLSQIDLSTFGASSGNDCWGYVSPSGREYALMGLDNQVAFVEITDPANADWFTSISHAANLWGDVKVYQQVAYAVTELHGTGIQVIDLSDIDNHIVTLVNILPTPIASHNIAVDVGSGYLYTAGSTGGSATTVIFDLADPTSPVEVGTWDGAYEQDVQVVTYTSGTYAGRQIMFGGSEGRGLDIIDVTDKSDTFLISRTPYPNVTYCAQVWTENLTHLFISDELDAIQRTTVFDISVLENPINLGEYGSGLLAIDHDHYVRSGIIYEADYSSGLRIYDVGDDPASPTPLGWFDTYPEHDNPDFVGAWSCYPFFPSGTVIVSDIDRGLFVLDVSEATIGVAENGTVRGGSRALHLCAPRPNPFRPGGAIQYELPSSASVTLRVFSVAGRTVRTLVTPRNQSRGRYQVRWDGRDERGSPVSSGTYFYRLESGGAEETQRMTLIR